MSKTTELSIWATVVRDKDNGMFHPALRVNGTTTYVRKGINYSDENLAAETAIELVSDLETFLKSSLTFWDYTETELQ